ncbi:MAG TPA: HAMP domain-containing sensor histidine kinase [Acidimicrobiales bacterium]|nr:HAMP domain-containing sensor histidine kinase [Acidimicrobiales bacterium]
MTFRSRLVLVAAIAVVVAVFAAAAASYFAARNSLLGSIDGTLRAEARGTLQSVRTNAGHLERHPALGYQGYQFVTPSGVVLSGGGIPQSPAVKTVAAGGAAELFADVTIGGADFRELVVYVGILTVFTGGIYAGTTRAALQVVVPLTSVESQLQRLGFILAGVAVVGIALALLLAWLVGRTALVPLDELTAAVEQVAATTDVSQRLDPGGPDELGRLRRAFNHLLSALQRSQEAQRQLVLDAGHELRTPLTSLRTNVEVIRRLDQLSLDEREVLVDDLLTQMSELTTLVGDLSELARGEQRPTPPRTFRLDRLLEDAVAVATTHGRAREVTYRLSSSPTWVRGQRDRLERAIGNLLDNALKWSPPGGVVEVTCHGGIVTVRDHGPGIADEDLPHVFDRFYRAPGARGLPGSGLGLAIVAQVAHAEGGSVWAGSAPGGGAIFRFDVPTVPPPGEGDRTGAEAGAEDDE